MKNSTKNLMTVSLDLSLLASTPSNSKAHLQIHPRYHQKMPLVLQLSFLRDPIKTKSSYALAIIRIRSTIMRR